MVVFGLGIARPAFAGDLEDDDQRRHLVLQDEFAGFEVGGGLTMFDMQTSWWDGVNTPMPSGETTNSVTMVELAARLHVMKAMGVSFGYFQMFSSGAGLANGGPSSLSEGGFTMGLDAFPLGFRRVQTNLGVTMLMGDGFWATVYRVGVRIDLGRLKLVPHLAFTDFTASDEVYVTQSESWGWGVAILASYSLHAVRP